MYAAHLFNRTQINDHQWNSFVTDSQQAAIYHQTWYLDVICPDWSAIVVERNGSWNAVIPLNIQKKYGITYALQPNFAQYLGIVFHGLKGKQHHLIYLKKKIIQLVAELLQNHLQVFNHNFSPQFHYFLPFYWNSYQLQPRMSYLLNLQPDVATLQSNFSTSAKSDIKKSHRNDLQCFESTSLEPLVLLCHQRKIFNDLQCKTFESLWKVIQEQQRGFLLYVKDAKEQIHCGGAFLIDQDRVIFLASALDKRYKQFGANSLLIAHAIAKCKKLPNIQYLDFEGSMLESVEQFFRAFGGEPCSYLNVQFNQLPLVVKWAYQFKRWMG